MPNHAKTVPKGCLQVCKKLVKKAIFQRAWVGGWGGWPPSDNRANHSSAEASFAIWNWAWQQYEVLKDAYIERLKFNETVSENIWPFILKREFYAYLKTVLHWVKVGLISGHCFHCSRFCVSFCHIGSATIDLCIHIHTYNTAGSPGRALTNRVSA